MNKFSHYHRFYGNYRHFLGTQMKAIYDQLHKIVLFRLMTLKYCLEISSYAVK